MIKYSTESARAIGFLKRFYNDIEIYVEDRASPNLHLLVCRRILGPGVRLSSVTPLGGREAVLKACKADQANDGRKRLYVIDADLDLIIGKKKPQMKHLYRLRVYCIENLLVNENAVEQVCMQAAPQIQPQQIHQRLDFINWKQDLLGLFRPLFVVYGTTKLSSPPTQTVGLSVYTLCTQSAAGPHPQGKKILHHIRFLLTQGASAIGLNPTIAIRKKVSKSFSGTADDLRFISARDYIIPLLYNRIRVLFGFRGTIEQLKAQLAAWFDISEEPFYARRLRKIASV